MKSRNGEINKSKEMFTFLEVHPIVCLRSPKSADKIQRNIYIFMIVNIQAHRIDKIVEQNCNITMKYISESFPRFSKIPNRESAARI